MNPTTLFNKLYTFSEQFLKGKNKQLCSLCIRTLANIVLFVYYKITRTPCLKKSKGQDLLTISLTSFPVRIGRIWMVIESLLRQSKMADRIVLYLSKVDFPAEEKDLPDSLMQLVRYGLEIVFVEENLRSHKKYFYAFQDPRNEYVVTVDDDIIYPSNMIAKLWDSHIKHPNTVIARYAKSVAFTANGVAPYSAWRGVNYNPSSSLAFGSGGGTLFPVKKLTKDILLKDVFMTICPKADDLWLYTMVRVSGMKVYLVDNQICSILNVQIIHDERLQTENCGEGQNNIQFNNILCYINERYGLTYKLFEEVAKA